MHFQESRKLGFPILYGDASRPAVLLSAGITSPKAVMIMYTDKKRTIEAVQRLRLAFPAVRLSFLCVYVCVFVCFACVSESVIWTINYSIMSLWAMLQVMKINMKMKLHHSSFLHKSYDMEWYEVCPYIGFM